MVFSDDTDNVFSRSIPPPSPGSQERWMNLLEDQHVRFSVTRSANIGSGGTLFEDGQFRVSTFGKIQEVTAAGTAMVGVTVLERFDFVMLADQVRLVARGEIKNNELVMDVDQAAKRPRCGFRSASRLMWESPSGRNPSTTAVGSSSRCRLRSPTLAEAMAVRWSTSKSSGARNTW